MTYNYIEGGVTAALGYQAAGVHVGVKSRNPEKKDIALLVSAQPATCAGLFTQNKAAAAPILYCKELIKQGRASAILINSGNANAVTGAQGYANVLTSAQLTADALGIDPTQVLICSTGVIGQQLPMDKIAAGITAVTALLSADGGTDAAKAIMTTDTFVKQIAVELDLAGGKVRIGGMAKGSGMIHPNMATLLCFITCDAKIEAALLQQLAKEAADKSFNMITVDGDTSTNDAFLLLANGAAGVEITAGSADLPVFRAALGHVAIELAKMIATDGEGATKLLEVNVLRAKTEADAIKAAKAVAGSSLFKAACFGADANWGRIICAVGYAKADFDPAKVAITISSPVGLVKVMDQGFGCGFDEKEAKAILQEKQIVIDIDLHDGQAQATAWGCDLTYDYVKINGDYRS